MLNLELIGVDTLDLKQPRAFLWGKNAYITKNDFILNVIRAASAHICVHVSNVAVALNLKNLICWQRTVIK